MCRKLALHTQRSRRRLLFIIVPLAALLVGLTALVHRRIERIDRDTSTLPAALVRTLWAAVVFFTVSFGFLLFDLITRRTVNPRMYIVGAAVTTLALIATIFSGITSESITHARREKHSCSYFDASGEIISGTTNSKCSGCKASVRLASTCCCCLSHKRCTGGSDGDGNCFGKYVRRYEKTAFVGVDSCDVVLSHSALYGALVSSTVFYSFLIVLFLFWSFGTQAQAPEFVSSQRNLCDCSSWRCRFTRSPSREQPSTGHAQPAAEARPATRSSAATSAAKTQSKPAGRNKSKPAVEPNGTTDNAACSNQPDLPPYAPPDYNTAVRLSTGKEKE